MVWDIEVLCKKWNKEQVVVDLVEEFEVGIVFFWNKSLVT
jgi:hypothetical protein